jgi:hypothetical protein
MARPRKAPREHVWLATFAKEELGVLVHDLYMERDFPVEAPDLLGALVLAARGLPLEVAQALMPPYVAREREVMQKAAGEASTDAD